MENRRDIARELGRKYYPLSSESLDALSSILIPMKYAKGDVILREGDVCKYLYFIDKGLVRQYYFKGGKEVTEHISYEKRMVICIESFLKQVPTTLIVEALEPTLVYLVPHDRLEMLTETSRQIELLYRKILEYALIRSQVHADIRRFESAPERYKRLLNSQPEIFLRAPLVHIASYLQMTPETMSRVRASIAAESKI